MMHRNGTAPWRAIYSSQRAIWIASALALTLSGCAYLPRGGAPEAATGGAYQAGDRVALLLPTEGPLLGVADAVRDGIRAATSVDEDKGRPKLVPVDGVDPGRVSQGLGQAIDAGATQAIGPIDKPSVDALAAQEALGIPTLALNEATSAGRPARNLFQFSLSPEAEVAEVASNAKALGLSRALMLYPDDGAGKRRADAFRSQWTRQGGTLVGELALSPGGTASPADLRGLLVSRAPDFVFLAANAEQARVWYPQLRKEAPSLMVIATSDVYTGDRDPVRDRALDGLHFVDMPWMLGVEKANDPLRRPDQRSAAAHLATPLGRRLYAMGIDAYRLAPRLKALAETPGSSFAGQTGRLSVDPLGRVRRQLILARFTESGPEPVAGVTSSGRETRASNPRPEPPGRG